MSDIRGLVEEARKRGRLRQEEVAETLRVTQGHYSKVVRGKAELTKELGERMQVWLKARSEPSSDERSNERIRALASSIRSQCIELMQLTLTGTPDRASTSAGRE